MLITEAVGAFDPSPVRVARAGSTGVCQGMVFPAARLGRAAGAWAPKLRY